MSRVLLVNLGNGATRSKCSEIANAIVIPVLRRKADSITTNALHKLRHVGVASLGQSFKCA